MSCNWKTVTLAEVTSRIGDGLHGTPKYDDCGDYYFINGNNLSNGRIVINENTKRTDKEQYLKHKKDLSDRTILVSINGTLGNIGTYQGEKVFLGKSACYLNVLPNIDKNYIKYVLTAKHFQDYIHNLATGSTIKNAGLKLIREYAFQLPNAETQKNISSVLSAIDSKITINTQTNQTLEEMAQAIFKSWFVDFDPVKAKMNGEQPEGMDEATASLFPDKLVESELGLIPDGWEAGTVGSVTAAKGGYAFKSKQFIDEGNPVIKIKNITSAGTVTTSDCQCVDDDIARTASRFKLSDGDLLMAMTGATVGKSGIYVSDGRDGYLNQRVARFESKVDKSQPCWFTYNLVNRDSIFEQIVGAAQGSAQPNISSNGIEQVKTVVPTFDLIHKYQEVVSPLYAKWISNFKENSHLSELRDTLLPKLLSGEIDLAETTI
ncbi:restriction endonuclease subunit S [Shewanella sp. SM74]|uniref:restriction endonuclease subunit S n=1 Tax=Shewanella sp. SM74 TaxID=2912807 RepID=UPI0021D882C1|nr:restriction endonuclease subunit S [Shewanella sp. SM74]MCU8014926.1 restriction endonuclease subunit S [Shewanella sp. SM74]